MSLACDRDWGLSGRVSALHSVATGLISSGGDHGRHCCCDLIRSKQLSSVSVCWVQVFARFSGYDDLIHNKRNIPICLITFVYLLYICICLCVYSPEKYKIMNTRSLCVMHNHQTGKWYLSVDLSIHFPWSFTIWLIPYLFPSIWAAIYIYMELAHWPSG